MQTRLLDFITCPKCQQERFSVNILKGNSLEIEEGELLCNSCFQRYRIVDSILILISKDYPLEFDNERLREYQSYRFTVDRNISRLILRYSNGISLDAGCGRGVYAPFFRGELIAFDYSFLFVKQAYNGYKHDKTKHFLVADIADFPFKDKKFNLTTCNYVFEYVKPEKAYEVIRHLDRVTKGRIIFAESIRVPLVDIAKKCISFLGFYSKEFAGVKISRERLSAELNQKNNLANLFLLRQRGYKVRGAIGWVTRKYIKPAIIADLIDFILRYLPFLSGNIIGIKQLWKTEIS